jgi:hypothetical protein
MVYSGANPRTSDLIQKAAGGTALKDVGLCDGGKPNSLETICMTSMLRGIWVPCTNMASFRRAHTQRYSEWFGT